MFFICLLLFDLRYGFAAEQLIFSDVEMNLTRTLLHALIYDRSIRPARHHRHATNVSFDLSLAQLIDVDEKNQIITTNQWLTMSWFDPKLRWNPLSWDNVSQLHLKYDKVWLPDIVLYNVCARDDDALFYSLFVPLENADNLASLSQISSNVMVSADGVVTWLSTAIFRSSCSIDVRYFPFDEQNCTLKFASWTYDSARIDLEAKSPVGDLSNFMANSEWEIVRLHVKKNVVKYSCCPETFPDLTYTIQMRRRPLFYVFNMILPCFLITMVAFLGFCVPSDSGEKVSIGVTTLLSMIVFLMLVTDNMPPNSDSLPLISVYYLAAMLVVSIATAMSVASLNVYHRGKSSRQPVPKVLRRFLSLQRSTVAPDRRMSSIGTEEGAHSSNSVPLILRSPSSSAKKKKRSMLHDQWQTSMDYLYRLIAQHQSRSREQFEQNLIAEEWQLLGRRVDQLLVYLFLFGTIFIFGLIFGQVPHLRLK